MKNLLELDLICCLDAPRMLQCVLLSSLQVPAHNPGRGQGLALFFMTQLVCTDQIRQDLSAPSGLSPCKEQPLP